MATIKEIADELGVSKTAVNKKIDNLGLRNKLSKIGNQFTLNKNQEELIKSAFEKKETQTKTKTKTQTETETFPAIVCVLQKELEQKDKQINDLMEQLAKTTEALQMAQESVKVAQMLQANTEQKLLAIEQKSEENLEEPKKKWWHFGK